MMHIFKIKCLLYITVPTILICIALTSCDREPRYKNDGKQVTWNTKDIWAAHHSRIVDADPSTFDDLGDGYARDAQHAFLKGVIINGADGKSFKCLEKGYAMDSNHVFYDTIMIPSFLVLTPKHSNTFNLLKVNSPLPLTRIASTMAKTRKSCRSI